MGTALDLLITVAEMKRGRAYSTLICTGLSTSRGSYPLKIEIVFPYGFTVRVSYKRCTLLCFAFIPPCLVSSKLRDQVDVANVTDSIQGRNRAAQCRIPGENSSGAARAFPHCRRHPSLKRVQEIQPKVRFRNETRIQSISIPLHSSTLRTFLQSMVRRRDQYGACRSGTVCFATTSLPPAERA